MEGGGEGEWREKLDHIFLCRWGPNAKETAAIKKYLETQNVDTRAHPLVGGLEIDLPALYHAVQVILGDITFYQLWNEFYVLFLLTFISMYNHDILHFS